VVQWYSKVQRLRATGVVEKYRCIRMVHGHRSARVIGAYRSRTGVHGAQGYNVYTSITAVQG